MKRTWRFMGILAIFLTTGCSSTGSPISTATVLPQATSTPTPSPLPPTATVPALPSAFPTPQAGALSSKPQTVLIYLVAIGDNGASGVMIGCGDSLVGVEIAIEPTQAVLRAALTALLNLPADMTYGQSGLYNSLYLSDLQIESLDIVDRQATIALSGTLIYGGECDIPRIEAQLTALALQFSTIDSVTIFVNGTPLSELLDLRG
ncbi:MAG: Uncharacterized protein XD73_0613 [Anaerolinea thermophila]|uniref:GerMN domain-containing protein n=1 Tax=Anaerolinea thermophila TaxID=167964 RepID=A0A117LGV2_9CHLR|nr:MAG: Uncharacterized protein XD73_0613 [Anaerolinea thermophila]